MICASCTVVAQALLGGLVTNNQGDTLAYANVYVKNSTKGTTTNGVGKYQLELDKGEHTLVFKHIGYTKYEQTVYITDTTALTVDVQLKGLIYQLAEVAVAEKAKDPAYDIIKQAIQKRKYYLQQINDFSCEVYMKGRAYINNAPQNFLGYAINIDGLDETGSGMVYFSEAVSNYYYQKPDKYKEVIVSSRVSGRDQGFTFNRASDVAVNFYHNSLQINTVAARAFVSPIANNALFFYNYVLESTYEEDGHTICKIKVLPKRKQDPVFNGYIYIQAATWRIHSVDLKVSENTVIEYANTMRIQQTYAPYNEEVWVLLSQRLDFETKVFAFELYGTFLGVYTNYIVNSNFSQLKTALYQQATATTDTSKVSDKPTSLKQQQKITKKFDRQFFKNEVVLVQDEANTKDSLYWQQRRPLALTAEEQIDYSRKDSIKRVRETKTYQDSIDRRSNKPVPTKFLLTGYYHTNSYRSQVLSFAPLLTVMGFNTVEGLSIAPEITYLKTIDAKRRFQVSGIFRYGTSNQHFNPSLGLRYQKNPTKNEWFELSGGKQVRQIDQNNPSNNVVNTSKSLLQKKNYMKLYERVAIQFLYEREIINGLSGYISLLYADRMPLSNSNAYNLLPHLATVDYQLNEGPIAFEPHQALVLYLDFSINFAQKYESYPNEKRFLPSNAPSLSVNYKKGIAKVLGSDVNYDRLQLTFNDKLDFRLLGHTRYRFVVGTFLNNKQLQAPDYRYMNNQEALFIVGDMLGYFKSIDMYTDYSDEWYALAHYEHHFHGFLTNKVPLVRQLKWHIIAGANAYYIDENTYYAEAYIGVENIFKVLRIDYVRPISYNDAVGSFRIGIGLLN